MLEMQGDEMTSEQASEPVGAKPCVVHGPAWEHGLARMMQVV